eukprot:6714336-Pyramimonas_sp.AAC.1
MFPCTEGAGRSIFVSVLLRSRRGRGGGGAGGGGELLCCSCRRKRRKKTRNGEGHATRMTPPRKRGSHD